MVSGPGPTKMMPAAAQACGELGVLGQETVAWMDRVDTRLARHAQDVRDVQVGVDGALALADQVGFVGLGAMQAEAVLLRIDRDRRDVELVGGAHHAHRDLAAIGDQQP
jgi:hypothetical protein